MILLRYHEIALKGLNRNVFEQRLANNATRIIERDTGLQVKWSRLAGRILLHCDATPQVRSALSRVFGHVGFSPVRKVETNIEAIQKAAIEEFATEIQESGMPDSFYVRTRRSDKLLVEKSMDLDRLVGGAIREKFPEIPVKISKKSLVLGIEVRKKESFVWTRRYPGPAGLPVGANGRLLTLLSGGIDSPVAAIRMLRRGCTTDLLHFHGTPFVGDEVLEKVRELTRRVNRFVPKPMPLFVVPFGKIQEMIALAVEPRFRTVLYRRMMFRIASQFAKDREISAIVTGESVGQVASQTVENLSTVDQAASIAVIRPLASFDKDEIIADAQRYDTFEVSVQPAVDCCTLFADRHPVIRADLSEILEIEARLPIDEMVSTGLRGAYFMGSQGGRLVYEDALSPSGERPLLGVEGTYSERDALPSHLV